MTPITAAAPISIPTKVDGFPKTASALDFAVEVTAPGIPPPEVEAVIPLLSWVTVVTAEDCETEMVEGAVRDDVLELEAEAPVEPLEVMLN